VESNSGFAMDADIILSINSNHLVTKPSCDAAHVERNSAHEIGFGAWTRTVYGNADRRPQMA